MKIAHSKENSFEAYNVTDRLSNLSAENQIDFFNEKEKKHMNN